MLNFYNQLPLCTQPYFGTVPLSSPWLKIALKACGLVNDQLLLSACLSMYMDNRECVLLDCEFASCAFMFFAFVFCAFVLCGSDLALYTGWAKPPPPQTNEDVDGVSFRNHEGHCNVFESSKSSAARGIGVISDAFDRKSMLVNIYAREATGWPRLEREIVKHQRSAEC